MLSAAEKRQFELPPRFTKNERGLYFSLTPEIKRTISRLQNNDTRAGFILQLAYFRANARFYPIESFRKRDLLTVKSMLKIKSINLDNYQRTLITRHRKKILSLLNWRVQSDETKDILNNYARRQARNQQKPKQIFMGLIDLCWKQQIRVPSYRELNELVSNSFNRTEEILLSKLEEQLTGDDKQSLEVILSSGQQTKSRFQPNITILKKINQSLKPMQIKENIATTVIYKEPNHSLGLLIILNRLMAKLTITPLFHFYLAMN